jgi:hypothetical protein
MITASDGSTSGCGTKIEDDDSHISYSNGWHLISNSGASGGHFRLNEGGSNQHNVALRFDTSPTQSGAISYFYATSQKGGSAEVLIDGVSKGTVNYGGSAGTNKAPVFGASRSYNYNAKADGRHTLEIRPIKNAVFIDGFCLGSATASGSPTTGPGTTSESSTSQSAGQTLLRNITLPSSTRAISIAVESNLNVPVELVLLDPSGRVVQTANSSSGLIILEAPITQGGVYIIKTVNVSLGPVQIWSLTTPWIAK